MAEYVEIHIDAGADYTTDITVEDGSGVKDLTNVTPKAQLRKSYYSTTAVDFTITVDDDPTTGIFTMSLDSANTANIRAGRYVYDVELHEEIDGKNFVTRIFEGTATVSPNVTRN